ncbi:MAG: hypothetical protein ACO1NO_02680, partial [Burkholderiaceae bacterium]
DIVEELDAAREAGMRTVLLDRRADYPTPRMGNAANGHTRVESFADLNAIKSAITEEGYQVLASTAA